MLTAIGVFVANTEIKCPSAQPTLSGAQIIGVVRRGAQSATVEMLASPLPPDAFDRAISPGVRATEVLRFGAACMEAACSHFCSGQCTLVQRAVRHLPADDKRVQFCAIRPTCRWFLQEGLAACRRSVHVVTEPENASNVAREVAQVPSRHP